jgi:hypothetical protein
MSTNDCFPLQGRNFTWFRNVQQDPTVVGPANCTLASACEQAPTPICPLIKECPDGSVVDLVVSHDDTTASLQQRGFLSSV